MQTMTGIDQLRLWHTLMDLRQIGAGVNEADGITRLAFSPPELEAKAYIRALMEECGLDVYTDAVGNVFGVYPGREPDLPVIMTGSHVDSVIRGGAFDGTLGVLGAIEAVRTMKEAGIRPRRTIEIVSFSDEEGTRFGAGYMGSKALTGKLEDRFLTLTDQDGESYETVLAKAGYEPSAYPKAKRDSREIGAFLEMHIEQGRVLEEADIAAGIVTTIQGPLWLQVTIEGAADHAGATPMAIRKDASLAMAEAMLAVEEAAVAHGGVGTVGSLKVKPGGINIIPGEAVFTVDMRHGDSVLRDRMLADMEAAFSAIAEKRGVNFKTSVTKKEPPATCSEDIRASIHQAADTCGISVKDMPCGAGHDALIMSTVTRMGMILVRSKDGISHNPQEWTSQEDCAKGTELLMRTLHSLAEERGDEA